MVRIKTITQDGRKYYVLVHNIRKGRRTISRTKYLGKEIPHNIDAQIEDFRHELFMEEFGEQLTKIKQIYKQSLKTTSPSMRKKQNDTFVVRFTYDSNRIEGSTLTLRETAQLLLENQAPNRSLPEVQEALAHQRVFTEMLQYAARGGDLKKGIFLEWHRILFKDSKPDIAGMFREKQVEIIGSELKLPPSFEIQPLLAEFLLWYQEAKDRLNPVELAALVHYKFVCIHPYGDGNGRISRMLMNFVLRNNKYPMYNIQNKERKRYLNALDQSDKKKDPYVFVRFLTHRYVKIS